VKIHDRSVLQVKNCDDFSDEDSENGTELEIRVNFSENHEVVI